MYNGIGLSTARGSGTNGYVQRNWALVRPKEKTKYKTEEELEKAEASANKQPNKEILDHERKRKIEVRCEELRQALEDQGYTSEEINEKVSHFRKLQIEGKKTEAKRDEHGRVE
ncbi:Serine/arginine repetitive matrix protein 2 [Frankliniella fusca]|uniref:Serine/arginine repetitive matrix protein 2 n=1 Tax=Frankliniella fusca TaxID=407009 RepID=A0AAE1LBS1_9NEOP|nr:Serine/arginine repetitive matrix protein 2 [Frankliniella fusca]